MSNLLMVRHNIADEEAVPESMPSARQCCDIEDILFSEEIENAQDAVSEPVNEEPVNGLAAAIARARQVKQEPLKTPRQVAQAKAGVKKI